MCPTWNCSKSAGRQGTSRSCKAINLFCTFVPAPIFCVEPIKIRTSPFLTFAKSSSFCLSEFASCIKAISSFRYSHSYKFFSNIIIDVKFSISFWSGHIRKSSCVDLFSFVLSQIANTFFTHTLTLLSGLSGRSGLIKR